MFNDGEVERVVWLDIPTLQSRIDAGGFCNVITDSVREYLKSIGFRNSFIER